MRMIIFHKQLISNPPQPPSGGLNCGLCCSNKSHMLAEKGRYKWDRDTNETLSLWKTVLGFRNKRRSDPISANILSNQILPPFSWHVCGMDMLPSLRPICQQHSFFRLKLHISNGAFEGTVFSSVYLVVGYIVWNWRSTSAFRQAERFLFLNRWTPKTSEGNLPSWTDSSRAWKLG